MSPIDRLTESGVPRAQAEAILSVIAATREPREQDAVRLGFSGIGLGGGGIRPLHTADRVAVEGMSAELAALREKLADEKKLHDQTRGWLRDEKAKVATSERELAELRAAVDKYGLGVQFSVAVGVFPTFSAACLAAYHAENAEVPNG